MTTPRNNKHVTMKDVAQRAGVSVMAVSKVLNCKGGISKETSQRIWKAAAELNYTPNNVAKSLRMDRTNTIGVMTSDSSESLFSKVLRGIEDTASKAGYSIIIANTNQIEHREQAAIDTLLSKRIDGLLLAAPIRTSDEQIQRLVNFGIPFAMLMRRGMGIDSVVNDNYEGGKRITDYLLSTGSSEIFFLSLLQNMQPGKDRLRGSNRAMEEHNIPWRDDRVLYCAPFIEDGYNAMKILLEHGVQNGAICCGCDLIATGAMKAIIESGYKIPYDFRVTGYDDIELAGYLLVPLTTISQPKYEIGAEGVKLLLDRIHNKPTVAKQIVLPNELVIREST